MWIHLVKIGLLLLQHLVTLDLTNLGLLALLHFFDLAFEFQVPASHRFNRFQPDISALKNCLVIASTQTSFGKPRTAVESSMR